MAGRHWTKVSTIRLPAYAKQTKALALEQLKQRPLDSEPHLPLALGAASGSRSRKCWPQRGQRTQAVALCCRAPFGLMPTPPSTTGCRRTSTCLRSRGRSLLPLKADQFLGANVAAPDQLSGSPVLLFFWAHWCSDCKAEAPIITQLRSEFAAKGFQVIGPTRLYGYTAQIEHASPSDELRYIDAVRHRFYSGLLDMPVPISKYNFDIYGASTTPTLVLLDRERQGRDGIILERCHTID